MRDLDRSMHRSLYVYVAHSLFIEGSNTTKNTASGGLQRSQTKNIWLCEPTLLISKVGGLIEPISDIIDNFNKLYKACMEESNSIRMPFTLDINITHYRWQTFL